MSQTVTFLLGMVIIWCRRHVCSINWIKIYQVVGERREFSCYDIDSYHIFDCTYIIPSLWSFIVQVICFYICHVFAKPFTWCTSRYTDFWRLCKFIVVSISFILSSHILLFFLNLHIPNHIFWKWLSVSHWEIYQWRQKLVIVLPKIQWSKVELLHPASIESIYCEVRTQYDVHIVCNGASCALLKSLYSLCCYSKPDLNIIAYNFSLKL